MKGRNGPTTFLPLSPKLDGQVKGNYPSIGQYLTREQTNFVYVVYCPNAQLEPLWYFLTFTIPCS